MFQTEVWRRRGYPLIDYCNIIAWWTCVIFHTTLIPGGTLRYIMRAIAVAARFMVIINYAARLYSFERKAPLHPLTPRVGHLFMS